jgi:hypothetical protein
MTESGLTPAPAILDSRQQPFAARLADACSSKLKELHRNPSSGAQICRVVKKEHEHGTTTKGMNWLTLGEESVVRTTILDDTTAAKRESSQHRSRVLDVVDRWIMFRRWPSGSCSSVQTRKSIEVPPQLSGHWTYGGLCCRTVGDRTHT